MIYMIKTTKHQETLSSINSLNSRLFRGETVTMDEIWRVFCAARSENIVHSLRCTKMLIKKILINEESLEARISRLAVSTLKEGFCSDLQKAISSYLSIYDLARARQFPSAAQILGTQEDDSIKNRARRLGYKGDDLEEACRFITNLVEARRILKRQNKTFTELASIIRKGDFPGKRLWFNAVEKGLEEFALFMLHCGMDVNVKDGSGNTALIRAIFSNDVKAASMLLKMGIEVNALGFYQPVEEAVRLQNVEMTRVLLEHGADPHAFSRDCPSLRPGITAQVKGNQEIIQMLREYGVSIADVEPEMVPVETRSRWRCFKDFFSKGSNS